MKMSSIEKKGSKYSFTIQDTTPAIANALRRSIMNETPTMAITSIEFVKNSSTLFDEMLAHRLGLVVLKTDLRSYNQRSKCTCNAEGCAKCQLKLTLNVKGPLSVTAKEIESQDPKVLPVYPQTLIVTLQKGQEIECIATAELGLGSDHAKFTPGLCFYSFAANVTVNNNSKLFEEMKEKYPPQIIDKNGKISKEKIIELSLVDACDGVCEDIVKVEYDKTTVIFTYEPWGSLDAKKTVQAALDSLTEKCETFTTLLKAL